MSEGRRKPARLKEKIMFNIEPMPSKVKFRFEVDENKEKAMLGDLYNIYVDLEPEDITITELNL